MFNQNKKDFDKFDKFRSLVEDYNNEHGIENTFFELSQTQNNAFELFKNRKNLLIIGTAGTGKSALVKEMKYYVNTHTPEKTLVITATTGIAAYNINGITINSFMGIGTGEEDVDVLYKRIRVKHGIKERIQSTDILIIDEVSMLSAELFEKINILCKTIRRSTKFFGGIQLVLTGDFYQLLPVFNKNPKLYSENDTRLIFESELFNSVFNKKNKNIINLTTNFRQSDPVFVNVLSRIRTGHHTKDDIAILNNRLLSKTKIDSDILQKCVYLVSSNKRAGIINNTNLNNLNEPNMTYNADFTESGAKEHTAELYKELYSQFKQKGVLQIVLKKNTRVMLIKNISVEEGLVNGSVGTVLYFENNMPFVKFDNGIQRIITPVEWELQYKESSCIVKQLPLMLCWAITHHKSQSLTLDYAILELDDCFCDHQVFVALSRLKTLNGLYLKSFNPSKITVNNKVSEFLNKL